MRNGLPLLRFIANALLVYVAILLTGEMDWASSKNDAYAMERKMAIDKLETIDAAKAYAKNEVDVIRKNFRNQSKQAVYTFWILIASMAIKGGLALYKARSEKAEELQLP